MAKSLGEALAEGVPVVFTKLDGSVPDVVCEPGKELQALELLEKMGRIKLIRPASKLPQGALATYDEPKCSCGGTGRHDGLKPRCRKA